MATTRARLEGKRLGLDTVILIYFLEAHREFGEQTAEIFRLLSAGRAEGVISMVGIAELLVGRRKIDPNAAEELRHELGRLVHLRVVEVDWPVAVTASAIRAQYRTVGLPDALHLATALEEEADLFLTNDRRLKVVKALRVVTLGELA